jgi:hypothetical protein
VSPRLTPAALTRLQWIGAACVLGMTIVLLWVVVGAWDRVVIVRHDADARWIAVPQPPRAAVIRVDRADPPAWTFATTFQLDEAPQPARLHVRAVRDVSVSINGRVVALEDWDPRLWKRGARAEVAALLRPGSNRLEAAVRNPEGPPLLHLWIEAEGVRVATGLGWTASREGQRRSAVVANDLRRHPDASGPPTPAESLWAQWPLWAGIFLLCSTPAWVRVRWPRALGGEHWPRTVWWAVCAFWLAVFATKAVGFSAHLGFDSEGHHEYLRFLAAEGRLPTASDGWSMFHPPLYHVTTALLRQLFATTDGSLADRILLHLLPLAAGLASAWLAGRIALRLFPGRAGLAAVAVLATGLMPMHVLLGTFVSNETVNAGLVALALWLACAALTDARASGATLITLSVVLGLALLTKTTTLPLAPLIVAGVAAKLWLVEGRSPSSSLAATAGMLAGALAIAGWFYWRNWQLFGNPVVTNYDIPPDVTYWTIPGFHTPAWYLRFGEVLVRPYFASFASFWDGLYSTFWGDGAVSGRVGLKYPNPHWDYARMSAVYLLALPATGVLGVGLGVCAARSLAGRDLGRRLALTLLLLLIFGSGLMTLLITLRYPHYVFPKAFYALVATVPLALLFAAGMSWLHDRVSEGWGRPGRALLYGYAGTLTASIVLAFLA